MATTKTPAKRAAKAKPTAAAGSVPAIGQHLPELGGTYIGISSDLKGGATGHLVLLDARPTTRMTWKAAIAWAESLGDGARLPTRAEAMLIFTNTTNRPTSGWHWTSEEEDASYAWGCYFSTGDQNDNHKGNDLSAVAVRRLSLQSFNSLTSVEAA